jgi:hypothetical protein
MTPAYFPEPLVHQPLEPTAMAYGPTRKEVHDPLQRIPPLVQVVRVKLHGVAPQKGERTACSSIHRCSDPSAPGRIVPERPVPSRQARQDLMLCRRWSGCHNQDVEGKVRLLAQGAGAASPYRAFAFFTVTTRPRREGIPDRGTGRKK